MTNDQILAIKKDRFNKLNGSPKNIKSPGVLRKINRQIRNLSSRSK